MTLAARARATSSYCPASSPRFATRLLTLKRGLFTPAVYPLSVERLRLDAPRVRAHRCDRLDASFPMASSPARCDRRFATGGRPNEAPTPTTLQLSNNSLPSPPLSLPSLPPFHRSVSISLTPSLLCLSLPCLSLSCLSLLSLSLVFLPSCLSPFLSFSLLVFLPCLCPVSLYISLVSIYLSLVSLPCLFLRARTGGADHLRPWPKMTQTLTQLSFLAPCRQRRNEAFTRERSSAKGVRRMWGDLSHDCRHAHRLERLSWRRVTTAPE